MRAKHPTHACPERDRLAEIYESAQRRCATLTLARGRLSAITGLETEQIEDLIEAAREKKDAAFSRLTEHTKEHACEAVAAEGPAPGPAPAPGPSERASQPKQLERQRMPPSAV
jgi:hypothetical protein